MNNLFGTLVYNDEQLSTVVYTQFEGQVNIVAHKIIETIKINEVTEEQEIQRLAKKFNEVFAGIEDEIGERIRHINLIIDPDAFYFESREFDIPFGEEHILTVDDLDKITDRTIKKCPAKQGYDAVSCLINKYFVDGTEKHNPVGSNLKQLSIVTDIAYVDVQTLTPLERVIEESRYRLAKVIVSSHVLKYANGFINGTAIVEFGRSKMKFITKSDDLIQNFSIDFGIGHIFEKLYMELVESYDSEEALAATRFLQENFKLETIKFDYQISSQISYNMIVESFKSIASEYVLGTLKQIEIQGITINRIFSITNDYSNESWVKFLNDELDINIEELKIPGVCGNFKQDLKVFNAIAINEKMKVKG